jgi:hypothetical protein
LLAPRARELDTLGFLRILAIVNSPAPRNLIGFASDDVVEVERAMPRKLDETNPFE